MWTDREVKSFLPQEKRYRISDQLGQKGAGKLVLDIQSNGTKTFFYQYFRKQDAGSKRVLIKLGQYKDKPSTPGLSLSQARSEALKLADKAGGEDLKTRLHPLCQDSCRSKKSLHLEKAQQRKTLETI